MSMSREDLIILSAANIFAATKNIGIVEAVSISLRIEAEVKKQRHAKAVEEYKVSHEAISRFVDAEPDYPE